MLPVHEEKVSYTLDTIMRQYRAAKWFNQVKQLSKEVNPFITAILKSEGVPLDLKYIPIVESKFDVLATSCAGAQLTTRQGLLLF